MFSMKNKEDILFGKYIDWKLFNCLVHNLTKYEDNGISCAILCRLYMNDNVDCHMRQMTNDVHCFIYQNNEPIYYYDMEWMADKAIEYFENNDYICTFSVTFRAKYHGYDKEVTKEYFETMKKKVGNKADRIVMIDSDHVQFNKKMHV